MKPYTKKELADIAANIRKFADEGEFEMYVGAWPAIARFSLPATEYRKTWLEIMALDMETQPTKAQNTKLVTHQWKEE